MKKLNTQNTLIIGTAHLGLDARILEVLNTFRTYFKADVIHTGPLSSGVEINMWRSRQQKLRTFERQQDEFEYIVQNSKDVKKVAHAKKMLQDLSVKETVVTNEQYQIELAQDSRINQLMDAFNDEVDFVCNEELEVPSTGLKGIKKGKLYNYERIAMTKHLNITAVPANGDKTSAKPITQRTITTLMHTPGSHIIPHATPQTHPVERPGLNQAYNYITTGCLFAPNAPKRITDSYLANGRPGGVLVSIAEGSEEFHQLRVPIRYLYHPKNKVLQPAIIFEGLIFFANEKPIEAPSADKMTSITDAHVPWTHPGVVAALRSLNTLHEPEVLVDGGDAFDLAPISHHIKSKLRQRENLRLRRDLLDGQKYLTAIGNPVEFPTIKTRVMVDSNHGEWLTQYVDTHPELKGILDWPSVQRDYFPDWDIMHREKGGDQTFWFGDLACRHGDKESTTKAHRTFVNYIGGHWHGYFEFCDVVYSGAGCMLGPNFLQNNITAWQNSLITATKFGTQTSKNARIILHNEKKKTSRFAYRGQVYEVPFYDYKKVA